MAEETDLEFVSKMDYVLELPDVIRKGAYSGKTVNGLKKMLDSTPKLCYNNYRCSTRVLV